MRAPASTAACWMDGRRVTSREAQVPLDDPVLQAGLGLFETIATREGRLLELEEHLGRMAEGAARLEIELPPNRQLREVVVEAAGQQSAVYGWLKIVVTGGGRWFVYADAIDPGEVGSVATAVLLPWRRSLRDPLSGMKTLNYAASRLGLAEARRRGADDGIWLNSRGHLAEGCTSNLFVVDRGKLFTPAVSDGILPGVVRGLVLRAAGNLGCQAHQGKLRLRRLELADEAFLTSSVRGLRPLVRFEGKPVGSGRRGPLCERLAGEVERLRLEALERESGEA